MQEVRRLRLMVSAVERTNAGAKPYKAIPWLYGHRLLQSSIMNLDATLNPKGVLFLGFGFRVFWFGVCFFSRPVET